MAFSLFFIFIMIAAIWPNIMQVYSQHVSEINRQHKQIGLWLEENTPEDAIIATHDAGAIKFFSNRKIIDIWGLNNQDIFLIYRNASQQKDLYDLDDETTQIVLENMIWDYLIENHISYLIVREDLFSHLSNTSDHTELNLIHTFVVPDEVYLGNDTMLCYQII